MQKVVPEIQIKNVAHVRANSTLTVEDVRHFIELDIYAAIGKQIHKAPEEVKAALYHALWRMMVNLLAWGRRRWYDGSEALILATNNKTGVPCPQSSQRGGVPRSSQGHLPPTVQDRVHAQDRQDRGGHLDQGRCEFQGQEVGCKGMMGIVWADGKSSLILAMTTQDAPASDSTQQVSFQ